MRAAFQRRVNPGGRGRVSRREGSPVLDFKALTRCDIARFTDLLKWSDSRTNDFTIGGIFMWAGYFDYTYCVVDDTLFVKGLSENDITRPAFMLPVGAMPTGRSVELIRDYCRARGERPLLSAVPEDAVGLLEPSGIDWVEDLEGWGDYLYEAEALATLAGKRLSKKRNHVNRFMADHPDYRLDDMRASDAEEVVDFMRRLKRVADKPVLADFEREQTIDVVRHLDWYPFEGAVLRTPEDGIVAFTVGEMKGDTLFVHIEKMNHEVAGAGEMINTLFARVMLERHGELRYINREEDAGDAGLRKAKLSYHPAAVLKKYNVMLR